MSSGYEDLNFNVQMHSEEPAAQKIEPMMIQERAPQYPSLDNNQASHSAIVVPDNNYDLKQAAHPQAAIFTVLFKLLSILAYFFGGIIFDDITKFILVVIFSAADFWTVQNVTGRLLVGLRWWTDYQEDGSEVWRFESSSEQNYKPNTIDSSFFWSSQVAISAVWGIFLVINVLGLSFMKVIQRQLLLIHNMTNFQGNDELHYIYSVWNQFIRLLQMQQRQAQNSQKSCIFNQIQFLKLSQEHQDQVQSMKQDVMTGGLQYMIQKGLGSS